MQQNECKEEPTTTDELYAFIGIHIYMSIDYLPRLHMYWSHNYTHTFITSIMPRDRFKAVISIYVLANVLNYIMHNQ